jgi:hypothetical protein
MNKILGLLVGLVLLLIPIYAWIVDFSGLGTAALIFLKGGLMWLLLGVGMISLLISLTKLKD